MDKLYEWNDDLDFLEYVRHDGRVSGVKGIIRRLQNGDYELTMQNGSIQIFASSIVRRVELRSKTGVSSGTVAQ
jgi:hypothetical protein